MSVAHLGDRVDKLATATATDTDRRADGTLYPDLKAMARGRGGRAPPGPVRGAYVQWSRPFTQEVEPPDAAEVAARCAAHVVELEDKVVELSVRLAWNERELKLAQPVLEALGMVEDVVATAGAIGAVARVEVSAIPGRVLGLLPADVQHQVREGRAWYRWWKRGGE